MITIASFLLIGISAAQVIDLPKNYECPLPVSRVQPTIRHEVKFFSRDKSYHYDYTLLNKSGPLAIDSLRIYVYDRSVTAYAPPLSKGKENLDRWLVGRNDGERVGWYTAGSLIGINEKQSGFKLTSYFKPGIVKYSVSGENEEAPHVNVNCPDHFQDLPAEQREIVAAAIGPVPDSLNQVDGEIDFKSKKHSKNILQIDPLDKGEIEIYLKDSENFEVSEVDVASLEFGPGEAKVKRHTYLNENEKECSQLDFRRKNKKRKLKLVFQIEDIKVRCNLDYALFLKGKVGGKNLLAAQEMKPVVCEARHFSKK